MTDTLFCDISEFQKLVDSTYPYRWLSARASDGDYRDAHWAANYAWMKANATSHLDGFIAYAVYRPGTDWVGTLKSQVGTPPARLVVMVDAESWGGEIRGDHSADINAGVKELQEWLGNPKRVLGYGNTGDLTDLWPTRDLAPDHLVVADYVANPKFPGQLIHQYEDNADVAPFGAPVDLNSADGYSSAQLCAALGLPAPGAKTHVAPGAPAKTAAPTPVFPAGGTYTVVRGDTLTGIAAKLHVSEPALAAANAGLLKGNPNLIQVGWKLAVPGVPGATSTPKSSTYTVVRGDTLTGIAAKLHVSESALAAANAALLKGNPNLIEVGWKLLVP